MNLLSAYNINPKKKIHLDGKTIDLSTYDAAWSMLRGVVRTISWAAFESEDWEFVEEPIIIENVEFTTEGLRNLLFKFDNKIEWNKRYRMTLEEM